MPKMTLLEMTQNILSAMDSDEVNSITDTVESYQVATVIKETYQEQFNNIEMPEWRGLIKMNSVSDVTKPNYLKLPSNLIKLEWLKYKDESLTDQPFVEVTFESPEDFFKRQLKIGPANGSVDTVTDFSGVEFYCFNDRQPTKYTCVDDLYLIFDSYNSAFDTTMQSSKSFAWGLLEPTFDMSDGFIPTLDSNLFPLLLSEAKDTCFINFKQLANSKEQVKARRQRIRMQNDQYRDRQAQYKARKQWDYSRKPR